VTASSANRNDSLDTELEEKRGKLERLKHWDWVGSVLLAFLASVPLTLLLSEVTWTFFHFTTGPQFTEEILLDSHGLIGYDWLEGAMWILGCTAVLHLPVFLAIRAYRKRRIFFD